MAGVVGPRERLALTRSISMAPGERYLTEKYYDELISWEDKANAYNVPSGGVRSKAIVELGPPPIAPNTSGFFNLLDKSIVSAFVGASGVTNMDWLDFGDTSSVIDAVDYSANAVEIAQETVSTTEAIAESSDWANALAQGWETDIAISATQNTALEAASSGFGAIPGYLQNAGEWLGNIGKSAAESIIKNKLTQAFAPSPMPTTTRPVIGYTSSPQQNVGPLSGLAGWLYPALGQRSGTYSGASNNRLFGFGSGAPISRKNEASEGGFPFKPIWILFAAIFFIVFAVVLRR